jgi:hypothetical protein
MSCEKEHQRAQKSLQNAENKGLSVGKMAQMRREEHLDGGTLPVACVAKIMRYITIYLYIGLVIFDTGSAARVIWTNMVFEVGKEH